MYYAINGDTRLAAEQLKWVKRQENGIFVLCEEAEGTGVIFGGEIYHVSGRPDIDKPTVDIVWEDDTKKLLDALNTGAGNVTALAGIARLSKVLLKTALPELANDDVLVCDGLIDGWTPGVYAIDDVRTYEGQVWKCCQAHNSKVNNPDIIPGTTASAAFWAPYHATSAHSARVWVAPTGAHDIYKAGEYMVYTNGSTYKCLQDTNFSPDDNAQAWEIVAEV